MDKELELEAEKYENNLKCNPSISFEEAIYTKLSDAYIAGATSDAAKKYWYKQFEKQKLEFAIEQLKDIDKKCFGGSNTCKAKIKKLEQKLKEYE